MSTISSHSPLNVSETVRDSIGSNGPPIVNGLWAIKWSRDPQRCCEAVRSAILATAWLLVLVHSFVRSFCFTEHRLQTKNVLKVVHRTERPLQALTTAYTDAHNTAITLRPIRLAVLHNARQTDCVMGVDRRLGLSPSYTSNLFTDSQPPRTANTRPPLWPLNADRTTPLLTVST